MSRTDNISVNILCIIYIDANIYLTYNKAIIEEVPAFSAPPGRREALWQYQRPSKKQLQSM